MCANMCSPKRKKMINAIITFMPIKREREEKKTSDTWDQLHRLSGTKLNTDNVIEFNFTEK